GGGHAAGRHIGAGQYRDDAGRGERGRCVDPANGRVRVRGAHERAGERVGELDVGHEPPVSSEKALILDASQRSADALIVPHARTRHVEAILPTLRIPRRYSISSRTRSSRSNADLSVTMKRSASPPRASWAAKVQCGIVNTSCCDHSNVSSPTYERPSPATTRQTTL